MTTNTPTPKNRMSRDNTILIIAIVVASLNLIAFISSVIAAIVTVDILGNLFGIILSILNTLIWVVLIAIQLSRKNAPKPAKATKN